MKAETNNPHLAVIIREEREKRNLTQEHLAELSELSCRTIQRLESVGTHSQETLMAVAEAFGLDCKDLLRLAEDEARKSSAALKEAFAFVAMVRKQTGKAILDLLTGCHVIQPDYAENLSNNQNLCITATLALIHDISEILHEVSPSDYLALAGELKEKLTELKRLRVAIFAGSYIGRIGLHQGKELKLRVAVFLLTSITDPRIRRSGIGEESINGIIPKDDLSPRKSFWE